ncbi:hypothetical protein L3Q82_005984 [Scortum barcoo]|uniref:Uncharacterized protein n=1 Tax=Scortum barcoo TaxID=214431 RepID=A0ACB8X209_9TELE|nr:hypothetical protein L3Q82_005984 [Scortum barcoo]
MSTRRPADKRLQRIIQCPQDLCVFKTCTLPGPVCFQDLYPSRTHSEQVTGQTKSGSQAHHEERINKDCYVARIGVTGPHPGASQPGLGLAGAGERLVAGPVGPVCPRDPAGLSPKWRCVGPPSSSRLTTRRKVHEGVGAMWFG